jgi:hypothetical protein
MSARQCPQHRLSDLSQPQVRTQSCRVGAFTCARQRTDGFGTDIDAVYLPIDTLEVSDA